MPNAQLIKFLQRNGYNELTAEVEAQKLEATGLRVETLERGEQMGFHFDRVIPYLTKADPGTAGMLEALLNSYAPPKVPLNKASLPGQKGVDKGGKHGNEGLAEQVDETHSGGETGTGLSETGERLGKVPLAVGMKHPNDPATSKQSPPPPPPMQRFEEEARPPDLSHRDPTKHGLEPKGPGEQDHGQEQSPKTPAK